MSRTDDKFLKELQARYRQANRKEKSGILDQFVKTTGYHRKHATAVLNGRRERVLGPVRRPRRTRYGVEEAIALATLTEHFDDICSQRLRAAVDVEFTPLYRSGALRTRAAYLQKLLRANPATMGRLWVGFQSQPG